MNLILFIHGLGGSALTTWGRFPELIKNDSEISDQWRTELFSFPTQIVTLPFIRTPRLQMLADGLRAEIDHKYRSYENITLAAHSLGGLVAKRYLVDQAKMGKPSKCTRLILYAVPNNGSDLANVGRFVNFWNFQLRQLCKNSDVIYDLNRDWRELNLDARITTKVVVGSADRVVSEVSARGGWDLDTVSVVLGAGHIDIVKPKSADDLQYLVLKKLLQTAIPNQRDAESSPTITEWVASAEQARQIGTIHPTRPFPDEIVRKRSAFESWWRNSGLSERRTIANELIYKALSLNARLYRLNELQSEAKPNSMFWNEECLVYFEQVQDKRYLAESLLDRAALYLELSQIEHASPDKFRRIAEDGDAVMTRSAALVSRDQQAEVFRIWSRFYYNLARPRDGLLSSKWDNNYLSLAYQKAKSAQELAPLEIKNATQLARATQRLGANPPQDRDVSWTAELRRVQQILLESFGRAKAVLNTPTSRIPPLNIIGVLTMDVVRREWAEQARTAQVSASAEHEIVETAISAQREAWSLVRHTEWEKDYAFDFNYDLGRAQAVFVQILDERGEPNADSVFNDLLENMRTATKTATAQQLRASLASIKTDPNLAQLRDDRRAKLRTIFKLS